MNYPEILKAYVDNGIKGWIDSECEGFRQDVSTSGHVRMHQVMMRKNSGFIVNLLPRAYLIENNLIFKSCFQSSTFTFWIFS